MTLETRFDGSRYPSTEGDDAVLREETDPNGDTKLGLAFNRTLADLVIDMLAGGPLAECGDHHPENWQTLENAMIRNAGLEVKALTAALAYSYGAGDLDIAPDEVATEEVVYLLRALSRRLEAGAELAKRLRSARWGHPGFGGGENWEASQAAKALRDLEVLKKAAEAKSVKPEAAE